MLDSKNLRALAKSVQDFDLRDGLCVGNENRYWDSTVKEWEPRESILKRHEKAIELCLQCPCLDACRAYANSLRETGCDVDGVIAGIRVDTDNRPRCRECGELMQPKKTKNPKKGSRVELASGFCTRCYPKVRRLRKKQKAEKAA